MIPRVLAAALVGGSVVCRALAACPAGVSPEVVHGQVTTLLAKARAEAALARAEDGVSQSRRPEGVPVRVAPAGEPENLGTVAAFVWIGILVGIAAAAGVSLYMLGRTGLDESGGLLLCGRRSPGASEGASWDELSRLLGSGDGLAGSDEE